MPEGYHEQEYETEAGKQEDLLTATSTAPVPLESPWEEVEALFLEASNTRLD